MVEVNQHYISQLSTGATIGQIQDDVDYPHTGLFKALMQGVSGNFVVKNNTNDFDITQSASDPVVSVAVGSYLDNGELKTTSGVATFNAADFTFTTNKAYYLLVVNSSGTVALRIPTNANRVANHSAGDTIIAMIEIADDTAFGARKVQFFTSSKTKNGLSIARDNSGAYTESASIKSNSGDIEIEALEQDKDIIFKVNDGGSSTEAMRIDGATANFGIGTDSPTTKLEIKGDTTISRSVDLGQTRTLSIEGARNATGTDYARIDFKNYDSHGPTSYTGARIGAVNEADGVNDGTLTFSTNNANAGITERMRIDDEGNVGIGTTSPTEKLHLSDADGTEPTILIENTGTDSAEPEIVFRRSTSTGADSRDIGNIKFKAYDTAGNLHTFAQMMADSLDADTGTEDGRIVFSLTQAGTDHVEFFAMGNLESVFNNAGNDINFRVEGSSNSNLLFVDAGQDKVAIGTNTLGDGVLSLSGAINTKGKIQNITEVIGDANGPPPIMSYDILKTDDMIIAKAPSGVPPNDLMLNLPDAEAADIGRTYRIVASDATAALQLNRTGTDDAVEDTTGSTLSLPYSLSAGKIYDVVCIDADRWMLMQLN